MNVCTVMFRDEVSLLICFNNRMTPYELVMLGIAAIICDGCK